MVALGLLSACGSSEGSGASSDTSASPKTSAPASSGGGDLFVVNATGGTLSDDTLELTGVDEDVTEFADRPTRSSQSETPADLVDGWAAQGFVDDPPNAAVVTRGEDGVVTTVVELGQPSVSGTKMTFPVTRVSTGKAGGALTRVPSNAQSDLVSPSLFIDAGTTGTLVPVTIGGTWGAGDARISLAWWDFSQQASTWMGITMGAPSTVGFTAADGFISLTTSETVPGTFSGVAMMLDPSRLYGTADVPAGSDLTITVCGSGGPTAPLPSGDYYLALPSTC